MEDGSNHPENILNVSFRDADGLHGEDSSLEHLNIAHVLEHLAGGSREIREIRQVRKTLKIENSLLLYRLLDDLWIVPRFVACAQLRSTSASLIENVVITLTLLVIDHSHLLKQIRLNLCTTQPTSSSRHSRRHRRRWRELQNDKLSKSTRIVISQSSGVSKRFQHGVGLQHLFFDVCNFSIGRPCHSKELHDMLCCLCLACATFTTNEHCLALLTIANTPVRRVGSAEHMRLPRRLRGDEGTKDVFTVESSDRFEGVQCDQNGSCKGVDFIDVEAVLQGTQHCRFVQVRQLSEVVKNGQSLSGEHVRTSQENRLVGRETNPCFAILRSLDYDFFVA
mmetsp:Transcript_8399/g.23349  ORF Transcript_8399/g.23349 Transcript_8399/m.23349 type:complete len:337 (+) Transcript_8399:4389-5399(+)